jgi:hypothetical protein
MKFKYVNHKLGEWSGHRNPVFPLIVFFCISGWSRAHALLVTRIATETQITDLNLMKSNLFFTSFVNSKISEKMCGLVRPKCC